MWNLVVHGSSGGRRTRPRPLLRAYRPPSSTALVLEPLAIPPPAPGGCGDEERGADDQRFRETSARQRGNEDDHERENCVEDRAVAERMAQAGSLRLRALHLSSPTSASTVRTNPPSRIASAVDSMSVASGRSSVIRGDSARTASCASLAPIPGSSGARNSNAWAPARSSIASTRSALASTCHAFKPEALPIDTWSSCPALVGIESTLAGWQSALFSLTRAAATYCGIMNPEFRPPSTVRNAGSPSDRFGLTRRSSRRSEMFASSELAIARASSANASGWPW